MRLTLRTLLAYLDDILEPAQTKEIGSKLAESKFASDLVGRIHEVLRRRRLTAPALDGADGSLNANVMAEYLDNTLPPDQVTDVEKRCLESDNLLAEAAGCHQILTLVLGEPVEISAESRRRMYGLVSQGSGDGDAAIAAAIKPAESDRDTDDDIDAPLVPQPKEATEVITTGLPEYLRSRPFWQRVLPISLFATAVGLFFLLEATDQTNRGWLSGWRKKEPAADKIDVAKADVPKNAKEEAAQTAVVKTAEKDVPQPQSEPPVAKSAVESTPSPPVVAPDPATKATAVVTSPPSAPAEPPPAIPEPVATKAVPPPVPGPGDTVAPQPSTPPPPPPANIETPVAPPEVKLVSMAGILLGFDADRKQWFAVKRPDLSLPAAETPAPKAGEPPVPAAARRADQLVAPEPFDSQLTFGTDLCRAWLLGGTAVRLIGPAQDTSFGFDIHQGRVLVRTSPTTAGGAKDFKPVKIGLLLGEELCRLELLRPDTQVGVELMPRYPRKPGEDAKSAGYRGGMYVVAGEARFSEPVGRQRTLPAGRWMSLAPADRADAKIEGGMAIVNPSAWLHADSKRPTPAMTKITTDYEREFVLDQPVSLSITTVANDARPKIAELAVKTLALTGQYAALVQVLAESPHEEAVTAAASGLRLWLAQAPENAELLQHELENVFHPEVQTIIMRLLWGYQTDDARDLATSTQLVNCLDHEKLAVRVLGSTQIAELTGGMAVRYRPGMPAAQRKTAKRDWEKLVEKNKGLLRP